MARPREFEEEEVIEKAMHLFWERGYQSTNLPDLLAAMGIVRGSFYKAFGSKKEVFLRALALYEQRYIQPAVESLTARDAEGLKTIRQVFEASLAAIDEGDRRGCLLCASASETSFHDAEIANVINGQLGQLKSAFARALESDPDLNSLGPREREAEARRLAMAYVGLRTLQRAGQGSDDLRDAVARTFLTA